jgi:signal recognition particle subunit SRP19
VHDILTASISPFQICYLPNYANLFVVEFFLGRRFGMRKSGNYYIYPAYFETNRTRQSGRRVPKQLALPTVTTSIIAQAAQRLGLECKVESQARYPSSWWSTAGVVLVKKLPDKPKTQLLKELAKVMKTLKATGIK